MIYVSAILCLQVNNGELAPDSATQEEEPTGEHEREEKMVKQYNCY